MKALVYVGPERMELRQVPDPVVGEGEVLLKVAVAGICGSDIHGFLGHSERRRPGLVMGHESVATILDWHPSVKGWHRAQRVSFNPLVACQICPACVAGRQNVCASWRLFGMDQLHGTYAELVSVPARQLYALSDTVPEAEAILIEPLAVVIHAFRISLAEIPETVAIFGGGPIGSLALVLAKLRGIPRVCVIDVNEERLQSARELGADLVINETPAGAVQAIRSWTGTGAEYVVEAVGIPATRRAAVSAAAKGGRLLFLGLAENDSALPWVEMIRNEQAVFTSFAYTPRDFHASVRMVESRLFDLKPWTETLPLEEGQEGFLKMAHRPGSTLKMMLRT
jgi:threonine dehydrogenase-like Zn-dependent dehydrogenase